MIKCVDALFEYSNDDQIIIMADGLEIAEGGKDKLEAVSDDWIMEVIKDDLGLELSLSELSEMFRNSFLDSLKRSNLRFSITAKSTGLNYINTNVDVDDTYIDDKDPDYIFKELDQKFKFGTGIFMIIDTKLKVFRLFKKEE